MSAPLFAAQPESVKEAFIGMIASHVQRNLPADIAPLVNIEIRAVPAARLGAVAHEREDAWLLALAEKDFLSEYRKRSEAESSRDLLERSVQAGTSAILGGVALDRFHRRQDVKVGRFVDHLRAEPTPEFAMPLTAEVWRRLARQVAVFHGVNSQGEITENLQSAKLGKARVLLEKTTNFPIILEPDIRDVLIERSVTAHLRELLTTAIQSRDTKVLPSSLRMEFIVASNGEPKSAFPPTLVQIGVVNAEIRGAVATTAQNGRIAIGAEFDMNSVSDVVNKFLSRSIEVSAVRRNLIEDLKIALPHVTEKGVIDFSGLESWNQIPEETRTLLSRHFLEVSKAQLAKDPLSILSDFRSTEVAKQWFKSIADYDPRLQIIHKTFVEATRRGTPASEYVDYYKSAHSKTSRAGTLLNGASAGAVAGALLGWALHKLLDEDLLLASVVPVDLNPFDETGVVISHTYDGYAQTRAKETIAEFQKRPGEPCTTSAPCTVELVVLDELLEQALPRL